MVVFVDLGSDEEDCFDLPEKLDQRYWGIKHDASQSRPQSLNHGNGTISATGTSLADAVTCYPYATLHAGRKTVLRN